MTTTDSAGAHVHTYTAIAGPAGAKGATGATGPVGPAGTPADTAGLQAQITTLANRVTALECGPPAPVRPWPLPVTTATYTMSADKTGATDVTAALNAFIATVPNGSIVSFPLGTYRISGALDLRGKNNLIFEGNGSTLHNIGVPNTGSYLDESQSFFSTQAPGWRVGAVSNHITIRNFIATTTNPNPGVHVVGEYAAFLNAYGGSYFELDHITATGIYGDLGCFNQFGAYAWVHDNHVISCGRNNVSIVNLSHALIERNAFDKAGYCGFDVEPENASVGSTLTDIVFRDNTLGTWGNTFMSGNGAAGTKVDGITISGNVVTGKSLDTIINLSRTGGTERRNVTFIHNRGLAAAGTILNFAHIDGLTHYDNLAAGSPASVSVTDCTNVVTNP